jgi:hypothetical protein
MHIEEGAMRRTFLIAVCLLTGSACAHGQRSKPEPGGTDELGSIQTVPVTTEPRPEAETGAADSTAALTPQPPQSKSEPQPSNDPLAHPTADAAGKPVTPPDPPSDGEVRLRERIQSALARSKSLSFTAKHVSVAVDDSDVTLEGDVRTAREKAEVQATVEKIQGVRRVHNKLAVIDAKMMPAPDAVR